MRVAKADLVPTDYNLLPAYGSWAELEAACASLTAGLNARVHGVSRQRPAEALEVERAHLHGVPDAPFTAAFGETRSVSWSSVVSFRGARYSVPHALAGTRVWVRVAADEVVVVSGEGSAAHEVARHRIVAAGHYSITEGHYPVRRGDPLRREPKATRPSEQAFLALGEGAKLYLSEAAAAGTRRIETRMAEAVTAAAFYGQTTVDQALQLAAMAGRFSDGDLESIIVHGKGAVLGSPTPPTEHSLAAGTSAWSAMPTTNDTVTDDEDEK